LVFLKSILVKTSGGIFKMSKEIKFITLFFLVSSAFLYAAVAANSFVNESSKYIEVCANGIVYIPANTKFVKCYGVIRKVIRFSDVLTLGMEDCKCPKCCNGECYVFIASESGDIRTLWLSC
jgi:hypothetical protein